MKKIFKYVLLFLAVFVLAAALYFYPQYQRVKTIREAFTMPKIGYTFLHMDTYFSVKNISKSPKPYRMPVGRNLILPDSFMSRDQVFGVGKYLDSSDTQGLLVIQDDSIRYEWYGRGQQETTRHISWSVAKSFVSALMGNVVASGKLDIQKPVDFYLPQLKGSGYEGVRIKDVLQMSSGVRFNEDYADLNSDINRWFLSFSLGKSQDKFATTLKRERKPGTYHHYVSINTHVLGMLLVKVTGKSLTQLLQEEIWNKIGMEHDAYWLADKKGMEMALGGLNATLRDFAKLGLLFMHNGNWQGQQLIPAQWVKASTTPDAPHLMPDSKASAHANIGYGYQWWIPDGNQGEFLAVGVFNQFIYVNPTTKTVIVKNAANRHFYETENPYRSMLVHIELFRAISKQATL